MAVNEHEKNSRQMPTASHSDHHLLSRRSSKTINCQIHEPQKSKRSNTFHLYDPKQLQPQVQSIVVQQKPAPLKKPVINLYRPAKHESVQPVIQRSQTKQQLINLHLSRENQSINNINDVPNHYQRHIIENPVESQNVFELISDIDDQDVPQLLTDDEEDSGDEDDMLPEARINRKV